MIAPKKHKNENERLEALRSYSVLDTLPEKDFDNLTIIASEICNTPMSFIVLLDSERQWVKASHGAEAGESPREHGFCSHAIHENTFIVTDARLDERFHDNPYVIGEPNVIFYAGVPLTDSSGLPLGTLCVVDDKPNALNETQLNALKSLANQVMNLFELRRNKIHLENAILELEESNKELERFAFIAAHDLKSPLNTISSFTRELKDDHASRIDKEGRDLIHSIYNSSEHLRGLIDGLLDYSKSTKIIHGNKTDIVLEKLRDDLIVLFSFESKCVIKLESKLGKIYINKTALEQILINLITNSIKHNDKPLTEINLKITEDEAQYKIVFRDNGPGIAKENHTKIFQLFETLTNNDKYGQCGNGIGLATVKKLVENLGGKITIESEIGKGTTFVFTIDK